MANNRDDRRQRARKAPILGQSHSLSDIEGEMIKQMIREESGSSRALSIPQEDLAQEATTQLSPEAAQVINESRVRSILNLFNRDYLYGQGRFDEYSRGLLLKWGDGYSRKHIWLSVEDGNLLFETSHMVTCGKPYCNGTHHVLSRDLYTQWDVVNAELAELFRRPVHEPTED